MKKILIVGKNSYIGKALYDSLAQETHKYSVDAVGARGLNPSPELFADYDVVINAAGIAHIRETEENRHLYYEVNRDLAVDVAKAAKNAGVRQYILFSSMSVYGLTVGHISKDTSPAPNTAYGESKLQADTEIEKMQDEDFGFACLRPPMVYGKGCKGNYQTLRKLALKIPVFPDYRNQRSMIFIGNLCEFIKTLIDGNKRGLFFPQNSEYVNTGRLAGLIASENGRQLRLVKIFNWAIRLAPVRIVKKVFGDLTYEKVDTVDKYSFEESIHLSEN